MTVRLPDDLADAAETIARGDATSMNQLIIDALQAEFERVRTDGYFQTRARELLERDTRIVGELAPPDAPAGQRRRRNHAEPNAHRQRTSDDGPSRGSGGR